jgi:hypothetical protein
MYEKIISKPVSDKFIREFTNDDCIIIYYKDLQYLNIDNIKNNIMIFILFEGENNLNHWIGLLKINNRYHKNYLEFFDSYGNLEKNVKTSFDKNFLKRSNQYYNYINKFMRNNFNKYDCHYNNIQYQEKMRTGINTCGRHLLMRNLLKSYNDDEYFKIMNELRKKYKLSYDEVVAKFVR